MEYALDFTLNGSPVSVKIQAHHTLLDVIRDRFGLKGTKEGCGTGDCGACTVLLDGRPVNSCLVLALDAGGRQVTTIEGISAGDGGLDVLQQAFISHGAVQCGYCSPGMILTAKALLAANPHPSRDEIRQAISGNLCRCTGYVKIVEAIHSAANGAGQQV